MTQDFVKQFRQYGRAVLRRTTSQESYSFAEVVSEFVALDELFPAEQVIYERIKDWLPDKCVLDIGVGAGRTSNAFGERTQRYLGVDYAEGMIAACEKRFSGSEDGFEFQVGDARDVGQFGGPWDLIFFSFNGVDHLDVADRSTFFRDVRTMLTPSGKFWFSSHNLRFLPTLYEWRVEEGSTPRERAYGMLSWLLIRLANPSRRTLATAQHAMINDGALGFGVRGYYGTPEETTNQLKRAGFTTVTIFGMDGRELSREEYVVSQDAWLTYLCE